MPANYYEFRTLWQVGAPREVLYEILEHKHYLRLADTRR